LHFLFDALNADDSPEFVIQVIQPAARTAVGGTTESQMNEHFFNRRRFFRRSLNKPAWIERASNNLLERCTLVNMCEIGARLTIMDVYDLPENFALHLTRGSEPAQQCRVIWQRNHEVGVEFLVRGASLHKAI
jgi:hypothetical protein